MAATDRRAAAGSSGERELVVGLTDLTVAIVAAAMLRSTLSARPPRSRRAARTPPRPRDRGDRRTGELRRGFAAFFGAVGVASFAGAALHGLLPDPADARRRPLWRMSLGAIGASAAAGIDVAAALAMPRRAAGRARAAAAAVLAGWLGLLAMSIPPYRAAIALTVPSIAVLAAALASRLRVRRERAAAVLGLGGLGLTVGAAVVQVKGIGLGRAFGRNALYHTIQAAALVVLGRSAATFLRQTDGGRSREVRRRATAS